MGPLPGFFAALLSVVAPDYYFLPPLYALGITLEFLADARDARRTFALRIAD